jgi:hypothetical protein
MTARPGRTPTRSTGDFSERFLRLYLACHEAGISISVKGLDAYLWVVPGVK